MENKTFWRNINDWTVSSQFLNWVLFLLQYLHFKILAADFLWFLITFLLDLLKIIDAHGLTIQGRGYMMFFAKIPRGSRFSGKIAWGGGSPYFGFYCIFINKCFEICLRGVLYLPPPPPPHLTPPPVCIYVLNGASKQKAINSSYLDAYKGRCDEKFCQLKFKEIIKFFSYCVYLDNSI